MASKPWFRLYSEFVTDPKVQLLAFEDQRHFVALLCLKCNGTLDSNTVGDEYRERMLAKALGLDPVAAAEVKRRLSSVGLIGMDWQPVAWEARQYESDSSAARVAKWRERQRTESLQRNRNVTVTDKSRAEQNRADTEQKGAPTMGPGGLTEEWEREAISGWHAIRSGYPRAVRTDWLTAEKRARNLVMDGMATWPALAAGVLRYRCQVEADARLAMNPARFFGDVDQPWAQEWPMPEARARQGSRVGDVMGRLRNEADAAASAGADHASK